MRSCFFVAAVVLVVLGGFNIISILVFGFSMQPQLNRSRDLMVGLTGNFNFPGVILVFLFGDMLARFDDPVHRWNDVLLVTGGTLFWTLVALACCLVRRSLRVKYRA